MTRNIRNKSIVRIVAHETVSFFSYSYYRYFTPKK